MSVNSWEPPLTRISAAGKSAGAVGGPAPAEYQSDVLNDQGMVKPNSASLLT